MKQYRAYCLDLDGTVYRGREAVEGAVEFISRLQQEGYEPFYVTNNASKTQQQLAERLTGFGIRAEPERIMSSAIVAAKYIRRHLPGRRVYMIGSDGLSDALKQEGIERVDRDADVVLMGMDPEVNFDKLAAACLEVRKGAVFISTNQDLAYPSEQGMLPGNGAFTTLVAASTGIQPLYIGKPESHMLEAISTEWSFRKDEIVMIGDNYETDILAGIQFGADTVHVNTGVTPTAEVLKKERPPTHTIENLHSWKF
ncbi:TIGR01457 family HAD-type hydrolase [Planococcus lenghuensis]|uniref:HAD family hydrolase n=1 Tax=Planococcus lenghuensis TaxID=2213202 RepID=A0A1Q2KWZ1_9BACL|nr:TIGR01457 family HAD-type hydrolase [Planococcus lenghuensis]AQQ52699.1 HAD family hydrolase [Planococcus lenghuensis]